MNDIQFSDNLLIPELEIVRIEKIKSNFHNRAEANSNLWEDETNGFISTPARAVKIGESIFYEDGTFRAYRVR